MKRRETRAVKVGNVIIGGGFPISIQSMTNTKTKDANSTIKQILALEKAGCEIIRVAVLDNEDALAIREIKRAIHIPLVADIHFDYRLALTAIASGVDKVRINPGNIGNIEHTKAVVGACKVKNIPIRIGINAGSLEKEILKDAKAVTPEMMIESAWRHVHILEELDFTDIILSFKASDVLLTIDTYMLAAEKFTYPLHLGLTEAGPLSSGAIKSAAAMAPLLYAGIGDTLRISISGNPVEEIDIAKILLNSFYPRNDTPTLISCPTCGRIQYDMLPIVTEIEAFLKDISYDVTVAIMGCAVNGPQEASRADIGVAGGKDEAILFRKGRVVKKIPQSEIVSELKKEIIAFKKQV